MKLTFKPEVGYHTSGISINGEEISIEKSDFRRYVLEAGNMNSEINNVFSNGVWCYNDGEATYLELENIKAKKVVEVVFELNKYRIAAYCGSGGSLSNLGINEVEHGGNIKFLIKPKLGYKISRVMTSEDSVSGGLIFEEESRNNVQAYFSFRNVKSDDWLNVEFEAIQYSISAEYNYDGYIEQRIIRNSEYGGKVTFIIETRDGEYLSDVRTKHGSVMNKLKNESNRFAYTFENITEDDNLEVYYTTKKYPIIVEAIGNGAVKGSDDFIARHGRDYKIMLCPARGYKIADVLTTEGHVMDILVFKGDTAIYTIHNVTRSEKLIVKFEIKGAAEVWVKSTWKSQEDVEDDLVRGVIPEVQSLKKGNLSGKAIKFKYTRLDSFSTKSSYKRPVLWRENAFSSIMDALDAVAFNGKVYVLDGNYCEQLIILKPVNIVGYNNPFLTSPDVSELNKYADNKCIVYLDDISDNVTISGIHLKGSFNHSIEGYNGICISGGVNLKLDGVTISPRYFPDAMENSIIINSSNELTASEDLTSINNLCNIEINNCTFSDFSNSSIYVAKSQCNINIAGNTFSNPSTSRAFGIVIKGGNTINIVDNYFQTNNERYTGCILLEGINNSSESVPGFYNGIDAFISGNDIAGFSTFGIKIDTKVLSVLVTNNSIDGVIGLNNCSGKKISASNNWWGCDSPKLGSSFSYNVNYKPYQTSKILRNGEIGMND